MEPMTRSEIFMAAAAGEYDGDLPIPVTREDQYWQKVIRKIEDGNATPEEIDAAIEAYLNSHDADIVTEAELSDALAGKVDKETGKGLTDINYSADEQAKVTAAYEARHTHDNKAVLDGITEAKVRTWDAAQPNVNADWNADSGDARILNKPDLSGFITRLVNDLANYYTKSETYTQAEVNALVSAIPKFKIEVVQTLPTTNISATTVYLVPDTNAGSSNLYTEYIYVDNDWEPLGTQTVDLSGYVTTADLNDALTTALATKADLVHTHTTNQITDLANAVASTNGAGGSAGLMSAADKEKLDALQPVILWSGSSAANTITLNESVAGYDMVEVIGSLDTSGFWTMSGKGIVNNGEVSSIGLCSVKGGYNSVAVDIDGCVIHISGDTLTRGSALPTTDGDYKEIHLNAEPSGSTLALTMTNGSNGNYFIKILRVIGYKAVSA